MEIMFWQTETNNKKVRINLPDIAAYWDDQDGNLNVILKNNPSGILVEGSTSEDVDSVFERLALRDKATVFMSI